MSFNLAKTLDISDTIMKEQTSLKRLDYYGKCWGLRLGPTLSLLACFCLVKILQTKKELGLCFIKSS